MKNILKVDRLRIGRNTSFGLHVDKLTVSGGTILCVVGPNGSGKTTLVECLAGLLAPAVGTISFAGEHIGRNLRTTRRMLGFVPDDEDWFVKELCAKEYFALLEGVYRQAGVATDVTARTKRLAAMLQFTAFERPIQQLSHGNKKKVQIIAGLMHEPKVIILDELRNGLDPMAIITAEKLIKEEARRGACVVATTHDLWWAQRIADETLLLIDGSVAIHKKTSVLVQQYGSLENLFVQTVSLPD
jgi:ABC-2 type transport system ATP-binding protein